MITTEATHVDTRQSGSDHVGMFAHIWVIIDAAVQGSMPHHDNPRMFPQIFLLRRLFQCYGFQKERFIEFHHESNAHSYATITFDKPIVL